MKNKKRNKRSIAITWLTCLSLVLSLCAGVLVIDRAQAAPKEPAESARGRLKDRVASDLRQQMRKNGGRDTLKVIVQLNDEMSQPLKALLHGNGVK
ncbi:MAG TPA: hypothetical protein DCK99_21220, partial [Blastocatellia bacterium]|nr:hypothetical protein [Blastocatellia bacterium]